MSDDTKITDTGVTIGEYNQLQVNALKEFPKLRDHFAMSALIGLIHEWPSVLGDDKTGIATRAYEMADAMILARDK
jgi:hypothetical protein